MRDGTQEESAGNQGSSNVNHSLRTGVGMLHGEHPLVPGGKRRTKDMHEKTWTRSQGSNHMNHTLRTGVGMLYGEHPLGLEGTDWSHFIANITHDDSTRIQSCLSLRSRCIESRR